MRCRHALRLDQAAAQQYAAEHHGVVWPVGVMVDQRLAYDLELSMIRPP